MKGSSKTSKRTSSKTSKQSAPAPVDELALLVADWQAIGGIDAVQVLTDAEHFIVDRLAPLAAKLVREHPKVFIDPGNPPRLEPIETRGEPAAERLTGAPNTIDAGKRLIYWLAAIADPVLCQRSVPTDRDYLRDWAVSWSIFAEPDPERPGCVRLRTWHQPVEWFAMAARQAQAVTASNAAEFQHSLDYRQVRWKGETFKLTKGQAAIVKMLHESWLRDCPWVGGDHLMAEADLTSNRINQIFTNVEETATNFWGVWIVGDGKGAYRLAMPCKVEIAQE